MFDELEASQRKLVAASRLGNGWLGLRPVWRPLLWKEGGRTRTAYLGKPEEAAGRLWKLKALGVDLHDLDAEDLIALASEAHDDAEGEF